MAAIGAIDDFYDLYVQVQKIYEEHKESCSGTMKHLWPDKLDEVCRKDVRKACEPLMNQYLHVFADGYDKIFANAYGFATFSFYNIKGISRADQPGKLVCREISFAEFLIEFQFAVSRVIHSWKTKTQPKYEFDRLYKEINDRVLAYISSNTIVAVLQDEDSTPVTNAILYIYQNLTSTNCYINKHPISETRFIASNTTETERIALPVHYCSKCDKHFIGEITLKLFEKKYGTFLVEKRKLTDADNAFSAFNEESRLFQLGYNVSDNRTDAERQRLLVTLLEKNMMTYFDMVRCIENNIRLHPNRPTAIAKWKRDLKHIGDYVLTTKGQH
ncbi:MAG: hypothetical protein E7467_00340 [Ruminococcaceae bacterium]|nr:hypothetical protein [Oscillospiraceae bacterium]